MKIRTHLSAIFLFALSGCGGGGGGGPSATFSPADPNANSTNPEVVTNFETSTFDAVAFSTETASGSFDTATFQ